MEWEIQPKLTSVGGQISCEWEKEVILHKVRRYWNHDTRIGALSDRAGWRDEDAKGMQRVLGMYGLWYDYLIIIFIFFIPAVVQV